MASVASPPRYTPPSASDSGNSTLHSPTPPNTKVESSATKNEEKLDDGLDHLDSKDYIERFKRYDAHYSRRVMTKHFFGKTFNGDNTFHGQTTIGDEIIKSSRFPCYRAYENPIVGFQGQCSNGSAPPADTQANLANGKHSMKK